VATNEPIFVVYVGFYPQVRLTFGVQQETQVTHWTQANPLTDYMDADEPLNQQAARGSPGGLLTGFALHLHCVAKKAYHPTFLRYV